MQVIELALAADGVALPPSCRVLASELHFDEGGVVVGVTPTDPPCSRFGKPRRGRRRDRHPWGFPI